MTADQSKDANLDLLRTIAVALVVFSHIPFFIGLTQPPFYNFKTLGRLGVGIFFVHTTLVLLMSLQRTGPAAGPFFVRRLFRIYPLAMAVVLLMSALQALGGQRIDAAGVLSNLLLLQHVTGHRPTPDQLWTLSYEVMMYLFLPALFVFTSIGRPALRIAAVYAASLLVGAFVWQEWTFLAFVPCFLPGAIAFVLARDARGQRSPWLLVAILAAAILAVPALTAAGLPEPPLFWVMCLALGLAIPQCRNLRSVPVAIGANTVAKYSYGIYLIHLLAMGLAFPGGSPTLVGWLVFTAMLCALALVCYHVIERPGIRLGVRLAARWPQRQAGVMPWR